MKAVLIPGEKVSVASIIMEASREMNITSKSQDIAATIGLPEELRKKMIAYAVDLRKKHPNMKPSRIQRKVAEHFKVKML